MNTFLVLRGMKDRQVNTQTERESANVSPPPALLSGSPESDPPAQPNVSLNPFSTPPLPSTYHHHSWSLFIGSHRSLSPGSFAVSPCLVSEVRRSGGQDGEHGNPLLHRAHLFLLFYLFSIHLIRCDLKGTVHPNIHVTIMAFSLWASLFEWNQRYF